MKRIALNDRVAEEYCSRVVFACRDRRGGAKLARHEVDSLGSTRQPSVICGALSTTSTINPLLFTHRSVRSPCCSDSSDCGASSIFPPESSLAGICTTMPTSVESSPRCPTRRAQSPEASTGRKGQAAHRDFCCCSPRCRFAKL